MGSAQRHRTDHHSSTAPRGLRRPLLLDELEPWVETEVCREGFLVEAQILVVEELEAALAEYVYILRYGFLLRVKERLEKKLQATTGAKYIARTRPLPAR